MAHVLLIDAITWSVYRDTKIFTIVMLKLDQQFSVVDYINVYLKKSAVSCIHSRKRRELPCIYARTTT